VRQSFSRYSSPSKSVTPECFLASPIWHQTSSRFFLYLLSLRTPFKHINLHVSSHSHEHRMKEDGRLACPVRHAQPMRQFRAVQMMELSIPLVVLAGRLASALQLHIAALQVSIPFEFFPSRVSRTAFKVEVKAEKPVLA
jgi:hypothetical protein